MSTALTLLRTSKLSLLITSRTVTLSFTYFAEATINVVAKLDGGKKKRKKKVYTKPKRIPHKHKKRAKALLEYFEVDNNGKITKLKIECEKCPAGNIPPSYSTRNLHG